MRRLPKSKQDRRRQKFSCCDFHVLDSGSRELIETGAAAKKSIFSHIMRPKAISDSFGNYSKPDTKINFTDCVC